MTWNVAIEHIEDGERTMASLQSDDLPNSLSKVLLMLEPDDMALVLSRVVSLVLLEWSYSYPNEYDHHLWPTQKADVEALLHAARQVCKGFAMAEGGKS